MFAYRLRLFKGQSKRVLPVALLTAFALLLTACGDDESTSTEAESTTSTEATADAAPKDLAVIEGWSDALSRGDTQAAAKFFAHPSTAQNGPVLVRIFSTEDAVAFNESLPCGSKVISASSEGDFTSATFRLRNRPGADCGAGAGGKASTSFQIVDGKIVEWRRIDDLPPGGDGGGGGSDAAPI